MRREGSRPSCLPFAGHLVSPGLPSQLTSYRALPPTLTCLLAMPPHRPSLFTPSHVVALALDCFRNLHPVFIMAAILKMPTYNAYVLSFLRTLADVPCLIAVYFVIMLIQAYSEVLKRQNSDFVVAFQCLGSN